MSIKSDIDETIGRTVIVDPSWAYTIELATNAVLALLAERGMVVLGPDGEPLDVRPALRALGHITVYQWNDGSMALARCDLSHYGITGPLADACLAAAEVEP